jgi:predicted ATP-grasp superfamily ATP-dependent carboligase
VYDDVLKKTGSQAGFIAPSTEALNRFLLEHRAAFEAINCVIPLIDKDLYEKLSDKYAFCRLCEQHAITIPKESPNMEELVVPFVAKPKTYFTKSRRFSPHLFCRKQTNIRFSQTYQPTDFYYQQYITGESYYLLYYVDRQGKVYAFSQQNLLQQPHGKSIVAAKTSTVHEKPISQAYESMLLTIGFRGLIMIEIKKEGDTYYMIEANPRFWGPSQLLSSQHEFFHRIFVGLWL